MKLAVYEYNATAKQTKRSCLRGTTCLRYSIKSNAVLLRTFLQPRNKCLPVWFHDDEKHSRLFNNLNCVITRIFSWYEWKDECVFLRHIEGLHYLLANWGELVEGGGGRDGNSASPLWRKCNLSLYIQNWGDNQPTCDIGLWT